MEEDNQIMLFERAVGIGTFDNCGSTLSETKRTDQREKNDGNIQVLQARQQRYVACCLRGGTIYLVPVSEPGAATASTRAVGNNEITVYTLPLDPDGGDVRSVQNFTAGMARVTSWKDQSVKEKSNLVDNLSDCTMKSVAVVGWPGGSLDVYDTTPERTRFP